MLNCKVLIEKLPQIKQNICLLKKLKTFYSSYFIGKSHFGEVGMQNYLVFQLIQRSFKGLLVLVMVITFVIGNLKDFLMKELILLKHLIMELLHT